MIEQLKEFSKHRFVRGVATLQSGNIVLNAIQALAGIALARILGPTDFGTFSLAMSMAALASALVGIGIQDSGATLVSEAYARKDRVAILKACGFILRILGIIAVIVIAAAIVMPVIAAKLYSDGLIGFYAAVILFASLFSSSLFSLGYMFYQVLNRTRAMIIYSIADQGMRYGLSVFFVILGWNIFGASFGHLAGAVLIFLISFWVIKKIHKHDPMFPALGELYNEMIQADLSRHLRFGLGVTIDRNIAMLFSILPVFLTGIYVSAGEVAYFKSAMAYSTLALSLLGPISVLLHVEFPKTKVEDFSKLRFNFLRVSFYSLGLSFLITAGAVLFAPWGIRILYGQAYLPSVSYVYGLFFFGALFGIGVGLGPMWRALNMVRTSIIINIITLGTGIPAGLWLLQAYGLRGAVIMVTAWYTISHFSSFFYLSKKLRQLEVKS